MARNILILGASYGSLLATKLLMAGHNVTLVCRKKTAELINRDGIEVRIKLRDEPTHRSIFSRDLPGKLERPRPEMSMFPVTISLVLRCRNRNMPTTRSGF
jgi:hypothetical protein